MLAVRAEMRAALAELDALDGRAADRAGMPCLAIDLVASLEAALHAGGAPVVGQSAAA